MMYIYHEYEFLKERMSLLINHGIKVDAKSNCDKIQFQNELSAMSKKELNILKFTIAVVTEFSRFYGISQKQAYNYLVRFKGMAHLDEFYDVLHTLSFEDNIEVLAEVCKNNGGQL